jgi:hypothetical protein
LNHRSICRWSDLCHRAHPSFSFLLPVPADFTGFDFWAKRRESHTRQISITLATTTMNNNVQPSDMVLCDHCGKHVPAMNLTIHKVRACQGDSTRPSTSHDHGDQSLSKDVADMKIDDDDDDLMEDVDHPPSATGHTAAQPNDNRVVPSTEYEAFHGMATSTRRRARAVNEQGRSHARSRRIPVDDEDSEDDVLQVGEIIDLVGMDSPNPTLARATRETNEDGNDSHDNNRNEWACPQCTLLNPATEGQCAACFFRNPNAVRAPDRIRTERLVYDTPSSPMMYVGSGALLGGLMGAAGSMMRGRSVLSGAAEGAMSGAVGGAFLHEVSASNSTRVTTSTTAAHTNIAHARSSTANGMAAYPSMSSGNDNNFSRQRPRASYRVIVDRRPNGRSTTIVTGGTATTRIARRSSAPPVAGVAIDDPIMGLLLHTFLQDGAQMGGGAGHRNVDDMSYEQLLSAFGDGSDNLGAEERQIHQLPTRILENVEAELPEDARQCSICLEDFEKGECRKTLPCLHGFHEACADKWLRSNGVSIATIRCNELHLDF